MIKCPYCGKEIPAADFATHHATCEKRPKKIPVEKIEEESKEEPIEEAEETEEAEDPYIYMLTYCRKLGDVEVEYKIRVPRGEWREIEFIWGWEKEDGPYRYGNCSIRLPKTKGEKALVTYYISGGLGIPGSYRRTEKTVQVDSEWAESLYNQCLEKLAKIRNETKEIKDLVIEKVKEIAEKVGGDLLAYVRESEKIGGDFLGWKDIETYGKPCYLARE